MSLVPEPFHPISPPQAVSPLARALPALIAIAALLASVLPWLGKGIDADSVGLAARYTARVSFCSFVLIYTSSAWLRLAPSHLSRGLVKNRRALGLAFAFAHTVHLVALTWATSLSGEQPGLGRLIPGGLAYFAIGVLAATSNERSVRGLGARAWKRVHSVGVHYIGFIFLLSYLKRLLDPERRLAGAVGLSIALAALGLRLVARKRRAA